MQHDRLAPFQLEMQIARFFNTDYNDFKSLELYVAKKSYGIKVVNLQKLSTLNVEQLDDKIDQLKNSHRFIAVATLLNGQVSAFAHADAANKLKKDDLISINGQPIEIRVLSESEYNSLIEHVTADLKAHIKPLEFAKEKEMQNSSEVNIEKTISNAALKQQIAVNAFATLIICDVVNSLSKMLTQCISKRNEERREDDKKAAEKERADGIKRKIIYQEILNKEILRFDLKRESTVQVN